MKAILNKYLNSENWLNRAEKVIPLGSQTFSKSRTQYPVGISPLYAKFAKGAFLWDLDGNKFLDLVNALAAVTLGYVDKGMNQAIKKQLKEGITLSLPTKLEAEAAEKIVELIPAAEKVRFGKNGSDATAAAIRLSRAYTNKQVVLSCGYHGWQDWYIAGTTRNKGVPEVLSNLIYTFKYNDLDDFKKYIDLYEGKIAAVIMEPMNMEFPKQGYLEEIRRITKEKSIVLIFDETITGFRFSPGGAQEFFRVTPDLATFGKGIANGMPLSAVVGNREIMLEMENIFFSGTFGGELLSLAAANYVIDEFKNSRIDLILSSIGEKIYKEVDKIIYQKGLNEIIRLSGHNSWKFLNWNDFEELDAQTLKTFFMQEMFDEGVLLLNSHNVSACMNSKNIQKVIDAYEKSLTSMSNAIINSNLREVLRSKPVEPLFKIR